MKYVINEKENFPHIFPLFLPFYICEASNAFDLIEQLLTFVFVYHFSYQKFSERKKKF